MKDRTDSARHNARPCQTMLGSLTVPQIKSTCEQANHREGGRPGTGNGVSSVLEWDHFALLARASRNAPRSIFSPQTPSAKGEGSLRRKNAKVRMGRVRSAKVVLFQSAINREWR